jgi:hypothetical protein
MEFIGTITKSLIDASKDVGLEVNAEKLSIYCYLLTKMHDNITR